MTRMSRWVCLCACVAGLAGSAEAASLKVSPARFIVHDVQPGVRYNIYEGTGLRLTVYNDDTVSRSWVLSTHRPSERGRWEKGYGEIPDPRWCWFEQDEITVAPNDKAYAYLHVEIPDEEQYYNQHWVVTLSVRGRPGAGGISLAVDVRTQIETASKDGLRVRPAGLLGLEPSRVRFQDVEPGKAKEAGIRIYNSDDKAHDYTISSLFDNEDVDRKTYLTHSYAEIPDSGWLVRPARLRVEAGDLALLNVTLTVPDDAANFDKKWEDIFLIQPDDGLAGFARVQVETKTQGN